MFQIAEENLTNAFKGLFGNVKLNMEKIEDNDIPESFKGTPIVLLTACLMAIAFFGFSGLK